MRKRFDEQLEFLNKELIVMGSLCESAISKSAKAFTENDIELAKQVLENGMLIDQKEREIESVCLKMLLQQQPVAHDLRLISAALKMITDMERIGDQAEDIAEIVITAKLTVNEKVHHILDMANATKNMVSKSIDAYVAKDKDLALEVIKDDDIVDDLFLEVKKDLLIIEGSKENTEGVLDLLMIAKYLERIGDHATNIAGWVLFSITGEHETKQ